MIRPLKNNLASIVWAVDPLGDRKVHESAAQLLKVLHRKYSINPVSIYGHTELPFELSPLALQAGLKRTETNANKVIEELKVKKYVGALRVLPHSNSSIRGQTQALAQYAYKNKSEFIVMSSHARKGWIRQIMGSFAEALLHKSRVPVLIVSAKAEVQSRAGIILFPTDLSGESFKSFKKVVRFAKKMKASIQIYHQYQGLPQDLPKEVIFLKNKKWLDADQIVERNFKMAQAKSKRWSRWGRKNGVSCHVELQFGWENIAALVMTWSKKNKPWMIAMSSQTGPMASALLGSNTRWVIRDAKCPVFIVP